MGPAGLDEAATSLSQLREQRAKTTKKLANLINALAEGIVVASDTFKATVKSTEADSERLGNLIATQERIMGSRMNAITLEQAEAYSTQLREKLLSSGPALQKRIIRSFVKSVVISDNEIVILGANADLAEVVTGSLTT